MDQGVGAEWVAGFRKIKTNLSLNFTKICKTEF